MKDVIVFTIKTLPEMDGLPCMKNLGAIIARHALVTKGEYTYHDADTKQPYKIVLTK